MPLAIKPCVYQANLLRLSSPPNLAPMHALGCAESVRYSPGAATDSGDDEDGNGAGSFSRTNSSSTEHGVGVRTESADDSDGGGPDDGNADEAGGSTRGRHMRRRHASGQARVGRDGVGIGAEARRLGQQEEMQIGGVFGNRRGTDQPAGQAIHRQHKQHRRLQQAAAAAPPSGRHHRSPHATSHWEDDHAEEVEEGGGDSSQQGALVEALSNQVSSLRLRMHAFAYGILEGNISMLTFLPAASIIRPNCMHVLPCFQVERLSGQLTQALDQLSAMQAALDGARQQLERAEDQVSACSWPSTW